MIAADTLVCLDHVSHHSVALRSTTMRDDAFVLTLQPGDCYQSSGGERVTVRIGSTYRLDHGSDGGFNKKLHKPGTYKVEKSKKPTGVTIRVY